MGAPRERIRIDTVPAPRSGRGRSNTLMAPRSISGCNSMRREGPGSHYRRGPTASLEMIEEISSNLRHRSGKRRGLSAATPTSSRQQPKLHGLATDAGHETARPMCARRFEAISGWSVADLERGPASRCRVIYRACHESYGYLVMDWCRPQPPGVHPPHVHERYHRRRC